MNRILCLVFAGLFAAMGLASCQKAALDSDASRVSYGIGLQVARDLKGRGIDLDLEAFQSALEDVFSGKESRISDEDLRQAFMNYSQTMMKKQEAGAAESLKTGEEYLKQNSLKEGVVVTKSGLQYRVLRQGAGASPRPTDLVTVHYSGKLIDGKEFDSSYKRNQPAQFQLNQVIPGWSEGVQLMKVGSKYELTVPAALGYGEGGTQGIPGNSVLIFEVELLDVKRQ
jgi:FKBP-type peptidyl-prolyl cis-trans isomerase